MLTWLALSCLMVLMMVVAIQDFRDRAISAYLPLLVFISSFLYAYCWVETRELATITALNISLLLFQFAILYLYVRIFKKADSLTESYLGWGDILFLLALSPLFSPLNFIIFNLLAFVLVAVGYLLYTQINKNANKHIPLAGLFALLLGPALLIIKITNMQYEVYNDYWLLNKLSM